MYVHKTIKCNVKNYKKRKNYLGNRICRLTALHPQVEDRWSWVIPLPDISLNSSIVPMDPIRLTTWSLGTVPDEGHWVHFHKMYTHNESVVHPLISGTNRLSDRIHDIHKDLYAYGDMTLTASKDWLVYL